MPTLAIGQIFIVVNGVIWNKIIQPSGHTAAGYRPNIASVVESAFADVNDDDNNDDDNNDDDNDDDCFYQFMES